MKSRVVLCTVAIVILAAVFTVDAQRLGKVYRIGLLHSVSVEITEFTDAFRQGMRERGYVEGKDYVLEIRARVSKLSQTEIANSTNRRDASARRDHVSK